MKRNLIVGFLILFLLNTAAFAGLSDREKESDKPATSGPKETKLSREEISRLSRRAEIDNLNKPELSDKEKNDSKNNLKPPPQENHHPRFYIGAVVIILIIVLVLVLV
jgi:hypothetical protein